MQQYFTQAHLQKHKNVTDVRKEPLRRTKGLHPTPTFHSSANFFPCKSVKLVLNKLQQPPQIYGIGNRKVGIYTSWKSAAETENYVLLGIFPTLSVLNFPTKAPFC